MASGSKANVPAKAVADEAAARSFDDARWRSFVRLRAVEIAAGRATVADVWDVERIKSVAAGLADFVLNGMA